MRGRKIIHFFWEENFPSSETDVELANMNIKTIIIIALKVFKKK